MSPTATVLSQNREFDNKPKTVIDAKYVKLALITYNDGGGHTFSQLAIVGNNHIHLLEGRAQGFSKNTTPQGSATKWLTEGVFKILEPQLEKSGGEDVL